MILKETAKEGQIVNRDTLTNYSQFIEAIETLSHCMDDYIFFYDIAKDSFNTSESVALKFGMPGKSFNNAVKVFGSFVHPDDCPGFVRMITQLEVGQLDEFQFECRWYDFMGNIVWVSCHARLLKGKNGNPSIIVGTVSELGQKRQADDVSGFLGMVRMMETFKQKKPVNGFIMRLFVRNMFGMLVQHGEENINPMLTLISNAIRESLDKGQSCYYHSRGVFIILSDSGDAEDAFSLFKKINDLATMYNEKIGFKYGFKLRAGVVPSCSYGTDIVDTLKKCQYAASYASSHKSKSFYIFDDVNYKEYIRSREMLNALQLAVQNDYEGFEVYYQPILHADSKKLFACEALLRYSDDTFGTISPDIFIPLLEKSGLIIPVGRWVLKDALEKCKKWKEIIPEVNVNVNLSFVQLERDEIMKEIFDIIQKSGLNKNLVLEFTESGNILTAGTKEYVKTFNNKNVKLALDDFGMGYSNLLYLNELDVNFIKIDRSFVAAIATGEYCYDLIKHIIEIAHGIGIKICVEGIETEDELERIGRLSPDLFQGFYFSKPIPAAEFEKKYI